MNRLTAGALVLASVVLLLLALLVGGWLLEPGEQQTRADPPTVLPSPSARVAEARPTARRPAPRKPAKPRPKRPRRPSASRASATPTPTPPHSKPTRPPRPRATVPTRAATIPTAPKTTAPAPVVPLPTQKEAEDVVRAYFAAIDADSYETASALTAGQATIQTQEGAAEIQRQADAEGVTIDLRVPELAVQARPVEGPERPVDVDYLVQAWVDTFLGSINARELPGSSVFRVARLPEGVRIVHIEGDLLPTGES